MKIYTKTGDNGTTSLYDGSRVEKTCIHIECLGDLDELNSHLGLLKAHVKDSQKDLGLYNPGGAGGVFYKHNPCMDSGKYYEWFVLHETITTIQCNIMDIMSLIATPGFNKNTDLGNVIVTDIEKLIDRLQAILPPITNFVVPSGNVCVSQAHVCRAITRRCERVVLRYIHENESNENLDILRRYINRLSDYLFCISRFIGMSLEVTEDLYKKKQKIN
jgi:cob(I)alamin adenosyltransferase